MPINALKPSRRPRFASPATTYALSYAKPSSRRWVRIHPLISRMTSTSSHSVSTRFKRLACATSSSETWISAASNSVRTVHTLGLHAMPALLTRREVVYEHPSVNQLTDCLERVGAGDRRDGDEATAHTQMLEMVDRHASRLRIEAGTSERTTSSATIVRCRCRSVLPRLTD